jgi:Mat/Ecp fimbriae major subunit
VGAAINRFVFKAATAALLAIAATPADAVSPATQATATARIFKPLTISRVQDLDFGTIVLTGTGFTNEVLSISQTGTLTCGSNPGVLLTCTGANQPAKYKLIGTNNATVTISSPGFNLTGPSTLAFTPNAPATVNLGSTGSTTGVTFAIGGSITLASTTPEGVYTGTFIVTADYQ